jgi:hypothetical protein
MVILTLLILGLKYCCKLLRYLSLPPWVNVIKHFIRVIYCHSMVFTAILMFYITECPWNLIECSRVFFWQNTMEPSMTHPETRCINLLLNLQNKLEERGKERRRHRFMSAHKSVPSLSSQRVLARMARTLSFHSAINLCLHIKMMLPTFGQLT